MYTHYILLYINTLKKHNLFKSRDIFLLSSSFVDVK